MPNSYLSLATWQICAAGHDAPELYTNF